MPVCPRNQLIASDEVGIYHCFNRCVRRAFLQGYDPVSGKNFDHRKKWIRQRLELLASAFAVEVLDFALMDNHLHLVLRNRPDIARASSDQEVALRWWRLCPTRCNEQGEAADDPHPCELNVWLDDADKMQELRGRLSSVSWFMRLLCQKVARQANEEDGVTGKFFESRFKSQALLDDAAVLACSMYVDLNLIRAGKAETPEQSPYSSAYERIMELKRCRETTEGTANEVEQCGVAKPVRESGLWLSPIELRERYESFEELSESNPFPSRRLTNKGFLPMTLEHYLCLLDWTGRQIRSDKPGAIPADLAPILDRLRIKQATWPEVVSGFGQRFHSAVGRVDRMGQYARRLGRRWIAGIRQSAVAFT